MIRSGVKTKVLMLSAIPVNNRFNDLKNQLQLAYEGDASLINDKLDTNKSIEEIFRNAQRAFNAWNKLDADRRTTETLLSMLDFDFFEVLDSVTIARSRKHIEKYYSTAEIGRFPERLKPISKRPSLTDLKDTINYNQIYELLMVLNLTIYTPSNYIMPSRMSKYMDITHNKGSSLTQKGLEEGIRRLMSINLLKRLESSVYSFRILITRTGFIRFYVVYIGVDGEIVCDYLNPKKMLDNLRLLCRGKSEPVMELCKRFNVATDDGKNMGEVSELLSDAINSIIDIKEESDIDSLFSAGGTSALLNTVSGLDDFELICFLVIRGI